MREVSHLGAIPRILLGTSPFLGAGQFGGRAYRYFRKFYGNPQEIIKILDVCWELGVRGIQLLPEEYIVEAIETWMETTGNRIIVIPSVLHVEDLHRLSDLEVVAVLLHASRVDSRNRRILEDFSRSIRDMGFLAGIATHIPYRTISWVHREGIKVDIVMLPINKIRYMMDGPLDEIGSLLREIGCGVIAKKILAAGRIPVHEAIEFVSKLDFVDAVAIGVASIDEAKETFSIARRLLGGR